MPETINIDTVDPSAVDELERLYELVDKLRTEIAFGGLWLKDESFAELRSRIAAGKTTMEDGPVAVEGDRLIPIAEYIAFDKAFLESELAALAWILESRRGIEGTGEPYPIPAELAEAARQYAAQAAREGAES